MGPISKKLARRFTKWSDQFWQEARTVHVPKDVRDVEELVKDGHITQNGNTMDAPHIILDMEKETLVSKPSSDGRTTIVLQPQRRVKTDEQFSSSPQSNHQQTQAKAGEQRIVTSRSW